MDTHPAKQSQKSTKKWSSDKTYIHTNREREGGGVPVKVIPSQVKSKEVK